MTPLFDDQKIYDPPPGATMLKKYVTPNARSAENMHFGAISWNKIFIKICSHPIIGPILIFFVTPLFLMKKIMWPPAFLLPPMRKKIIAPLSIMGRGFGPQAAHLVKKIIRLPPPQPPHPMWFLSNFEVEKTSGLCFYTNPNVYTISKQNQIFFFTLLLHTV